MFEYFQACLMLIIYMGAGLLFCLLMAVGVFTLCVLWILAKEGRFRFPGGKQ